MNSKTIVAVAAAFLAVTTAAHAQQPPASPPMCISGALAQSIHLLFQQAKNDDDLFIEAASQNLAATVTSDAKTRQKSEDDAATAKIVADAIAKHDADRAAAIAAATAAGPPAAPKTP